MAEVAALYRYLAAPKVEVIGMGTVVEIRRGFAPHEVDEMELWQIAEFIGVHEYSAEALTDGNEGERALTPEQFQARSIAIIEQRLREAQVQEETLAHSEPDGDEVPDAMMERFQQRRAAEGREPEPSSASESPSN